MRLIIFQNIHQCSFEISKGKILQDGSEGKERLYSLEMGGTHDNLDKFPKAMVNSSSAILH